MLAEGIICPAFLMHEDIRWEDIDSTHLRAVLTQYGMTVSGVFEFNQDGAIIGFYTKDRYQEHNGVMTSRHFHQCLQLLRTLNTPCLLLFLGSLEDTMCRKNLPEEYEQMKQLISEGKVHLFPSGGHPLY